MRKSRNKLTISRVDEDGLPSTSITVDTTGCRTNEVRILKVQGSKSETISNATTSALQGFRSKKSKIPVSETKRAYTSVGKPDKIRTTSQRLLEKYPSKYCGIGIDSDTKALETQPRNFLRSLNTLLPSSNEMLRKPYTLLEQKKLQWAKEKEELNGLWSPWGKPQEAPSLQSMEESAGILISSDYMKNIGLTASKSECHLPPIGNIQKVGTRMNNREYYSQENHWLQRKASLPACIIGSNEETHRNQGMNWNNASKPRFLLTETESHPDYENGHTSGYYSENNGFDESKSRNGSDDGYKEKPIQNYHQPNANEYYSHVRPKSNRINYASTGELFANMNAANAPSHFERNQHQRHFEQMSISSHYDDRYSNAKTYDRHCSGEGDSEYSSNSKQHTFVANYFENSNSQYKSSHQNSSRNPPPAPPAMRSSFLVGTDGPQAEIYNKELQKQEKENWLAELDQQRQQDRNRKQMEKDDKRPRWGDKGIGVGHFWEPSSPTSHLPTTPRDDTSLQSPAWLEKSLNNVQSSKSLPNHSLNDPNACGDIHYDNHADLKDIGGYVDQPPEERTFLRGQNVPIDPEVFAEKEKKRQTAMEHQEAIRKQIEERQMKLKQERDKREEEEIREEHRIATQRLKELQRVEMEQRNALVRMEQQKETTGNAQEFINTDIHSEFEKEKNYCIRSLADQDISAKILQQIEDGKYENEFMDEKIYNSLESRRAKEKQRSAPEEESEIFPNEVKRVQMKERSRSLSTNREFGTQTDMLEPGKSKQSVNYRSQNSLDNTPKKIVVKKEKPRWGANPSKAQYIKQSEKDPAYQIRLKKRLDRKQQRDRIVMTVNAGTNSDSEDKPVNKSRNPNRNGPSPARARGSRAEIPTKVPCKSTSTPRNKKLEPIKALPHQHMRSQPSKIEHQPKIELLSALAIEFDGGSILPTSEDESGTRFSSPSLESTSFNCSIDLAKAEKEPEMIGSETCTISSPEYFLISPPSKSNITRDKRSDVESDKNRGISQKSRRTRVNEKIRRDEGYILESWPENVSPRGQTQIFINHDFRGQPPQPLRSSSPPVPAVLRKIKAGIHPDPENRAQGIPRISLSSPRDLSPLPSQRTTDEPKHQELIPSRTHQNSGQPQQVSGGVTQRSFKSNTSSNAQEVETDQINCYHPYPSTNEAQIRMISPRPSTMGSEMTQREQFISHIMNNREVQEQLSARESELSEMGIIEFNLRVPSDCNFTLDKPNKLPTEKTSKLETEVYTDPLLSERERATIRWLYSSEDTPKNALLTHLSYLKQGIQLQQHEWGIMSGDMDGA